MDYSSNVRAAEKKDKLERNCCKLICAAPMTLQGYDTDKSRLWDGLGKPGKF